MIYTGTVISLWFVLMSINRKMLQTLPDQHDSFVCYEWSNIYAHIFHEGKP